MCKDNNPDCDHLFQGNGAVNTIVRLPDSVRLFYSSSIKMPAKLTIGTLSVVPCHLRAWLSIRSFSPTCLLALMWPPSTNWRLTPTLQLLVYCSTCRLHISGEFEHPQRFFCNRGGDVHFSVSGTNVKGISNIGTRTPSRLSHRRVGSLGTSQNNIHRSSNFITDGLNGL